MESLEREAGAEIQGIVDGAEPRNGLSSVRSTAVVTAVAIVLLALSDSPSNSWWAQSTAVIAVLSLMVAACYLLVASHRAETVYTRCPISVEENPIDRRDRAATWVTVGIAGLVCSLVAQCRFTSTTALAFGDLQPPEGLAWLSHLFAPWAWSGANVGGPANLEINLPWAVVLETVHILGGSAALAERIWFSILLALIGVSATALLRVFGLSRLACALGGILYGFSPYFLSTSISMSPSWLATAGLMPLLLAGALVISRKRRVSRASWLVPVVIAPLLGYCAINPQQLLIVTAPVLVVPLAAAALRGRTYGAVSGKRLVAGSAIVIGCSLYWIVPTLVQIGQTRVSTALTNNSWVATEGRNNLANALWLVTTPFWHSRFAYPFAGPYSHVPLSVLRFAPVLLASLGIVVIASPGGQVSRKRQETAGILALVACVSMLLSTGTRIPGFLLFDPLYHLPYGWLLQLPSHFLVFAALADAMLGAIFIEWVICHRLGEARRAGLQARLSSHVSVGYAKLAVAIAIIMLGALAPSLPLFDGEIVAAHRHPGIAYAAPRVRFPRYWSKMADFINGLRVPGSLVVLPPAGYYMIPRSWYYGNPGFVTDEIARPVIYPTEGGGYEATGVAAAEAVRVLARNIMLDNVSGVERIMAALGARYLLISGDVITPWPGNGVYAMQNRYPPNILDSKLEKSPAARLMFTAGPLQLFQVSGGARPGRASIDRYVTTAHGVNLRILDALPQRTALVTGPPERGVPALVQMSLVNLHGDKLVWRASVPSGRKYGVALEPGYGASVRSGNGFVGIGASGATLDSGRLGVQLVKDRSRRTVITVSSLREMHSELAFGSEEWSKVGDCRKDEGDIGIYSTVSRNGVRGRSAVSLYATKGAACIRRAVSYRPGELLEFSVAARRVSGAAPEACLWSSGENECVGGAHILAGGHGWQKDVFRVVTNAAFGKLYLFLYANQPVASGARTSVQYSHVQVVGVPAIAPVIIANPMRDGNEPTLLVLNTGFAEGWSSSSGGQHVIVDGMMNGWIQRSSYRGNSSTSRFTYVPGELVRAGMVASLVTGVVVVFMIIGVALCSVFLSRRSVT